MGSEDTVRYLLCYRSYTESKMVRVYLLLFAILLTIHYGDAERNCKLKGVRLKINKNMKTKSAQVCAARCKDKSGCVGWNWKPNNKALRPKQRMKCTLLQETNSVKMKQKGSFCG